MQRLYYNGIIITMEGRAQPEAVLTKDGEIIAVGDFAALRASGADAELVDLAGNALLPAFIDAHSHFTSYATSFLQVSLENCKSFDEIAAKINHFISENSLPADSWINCRGYDHNSLLEGTHPSAAFLDRCAPNNPLVLQHSSGHVGVFNSAALRALGVTPETPVPAGGKIGLHNGELTGYMEENAFITYLKKVPMADSSALLSAFKKAQNGYAAQGIATIQEGMTVAQLLPLYKMLLAADILKLDLVAFLGTEDAEAFFSEFPNSIKKYDRHLKLGGYKIFLDGSPQGRTAWMRTPYVGEKNYFGYGTMENDALQAAIRLAAKNNMQLLAHCNGDAAAQQFIDALRAVGSEIDITKLRCVMIHAQLLGRDQLESVKELGIIPSFFVAHVLHWGDIHIKNFGAQRAAQISPAGESVKRDILFTFHQDTPVIEPNMLETLYCAVCRLTKSGKVLGKTEAISVYDALKAVTINAAFQYFEEDKKGSLRVGKRADFVILDKNPLAVDPQELREIRVLATIKDDAVVYRA